MQIQGKLALVTGGTAGIGQEIAWQLAEAGARVLIGGRRRDAAETTVMRHPDRIHWIEADLSTVDGQERLIAEIETRWPGLAILVNNAGMQINLPERGLGDAGLSAAMRAEIALNLTAPAILALRLMPVLARQERAAIVSISSGLALAPKKTAPVYCATKAGLSTFSRALRYRCADAAPSIHVMDVLMPLVETAMTSGRGRGKITPAAAARAVVDGLRRDRPDVPVGKVRLLAMIARLSPALARRILRDG